MPVTTFYELAKPPRVVRDADGDVDELTARGWRKAPWLRRATSAHALHDGTVHGTPAWRAETPEVTSGQVVDESALRRRCLQRLNGTELHDPARREWRVSAWRRRLREWLAPPLPYGAPVSVGQHAQAAAKRAYGESLSPDLTDEIREELLRQASDGYRTQETRVAAIEAKAGAFEGYAAAAAGVAAIGAALLGGNGDDALEGLRAYALVGAVALALLCLIISGTRAYQAAAKRFDWARPNESGQILVRRAVGGGDWRRVKSELLTSILVAASRGELLMEWKLDRFKQASRYFSFALIWVIVAALLLLWPEQR
jgi:hypothetical protein